MTNENQTKQKLNVSACVMTIYGCNLVDNLKAKLNCEISENHLANISESNIDLLVVEDESLPVPCDYEFFPDSTLENLEKILQKVTPTLHSIPFIIFLKSHGPCCEYGHKAYELINKSFPAKTAYLRSHFLEKELDSLIQSSDLSKYLMKGSKK